jgi:uncharacterized LabA/DUF88 family protein
MRQVVAYVDGFNLYNGLKEKHGKRYMWLDLEAMVNRLLQPDQVFNRVRYYTAAVRNDPPAQFRQQTYLDALRAHCRYVDVVLGRFQEKTARCHSCGRSWRTYEEKETDISIALGMVEDAVNQEFDTALLISGDSDLVPAVAAVRRLRPAAKIVAAFPPRRHSDELRRVVDANFTIGDAVIRQSLLPHEVRTAAGKIYTRPRSWR